MIYPLLISSFALLHSTMGLKCHAQFGIDVRALAYTMLENNSDQIKPHMLSTPDVEMECTETTDVCAYGFVKGIAYMKGCTSSCEDLKIALKIYNFTCCNTDMCNSGSLVDRRFSGVGEIIANGVHGFYTTQVIF